MQNSKPLDFFACIQPQPAVQCAAKTAPQPRAAVASEPAAPAAPKSKREEFLEALMRGLIEAKNKFPEQYAWEHSDVINVYRRFVESLEAGTYTRQCHAVKAACKATGVAYTRPAIDKLFKPKKTED